MSKIIKLTEMTDLPKSCMECYDTEEYCLGCSKEHVIKYYTNKRHEQCPLRDVKDLIIEIIHSDELLEILAYIEHDRWAGWQSYLHSLCVKNDDGSLTIPKERVERWNNEIETAYDDLPEKLKQYDRDEATKSITAISIYIKSFPKLLRWKMNKYEALINHERMKFETCDKADREYRAGRMDLLTSPYISKIFDKAQKYDELMTAKKPIDTESDYSETGEKYGHCSVCNNAITNNQRYCENCGQLIDWSE